MTTKTSNRARAIAGLLGTLFLASAMAGLAGCNKRDNPPASTSDTTTPPPPTTPASDNMPATPSASAASQ